MAIVLSEGIPASIDYEQKCYDWYWYTASDPERLGNLTNKLKKTRSCPCDKSLVNEIGAGCVYVCVVVWCGVVWCAEYLCRIVESDAIISAWGGGPGGSKLENIKFTSRIYI